MVERDENHNKPNNLMELIMTRKTVKRLRPFDEEDHEYFKEWGETTPYLEKLSSFKFSLKLLTSLLPKKSSKLWNDPEEVKMIARIQRLKIRDLKHYIKYMESNLIEIEKSGVWK